jgi:hypothetical protein
MSGPSLVDSVIFTETDEATYDKMVKEDTALTRKKSGTK